MSTPHDLPHATGRPLRRQCKYWCFLIFMNVNLSRYFKQDRLPLIPGASCFLCLIQEVYLLRYSFCFGKLFIGSAAVAVR